VVFVLITVLEPHTSPEIRVSILDSHTSKIVSNIGKTESQRYGNKRSWVMEKASIKFYAASCTVSGINTARPKIFPSLSRLIASFASDKRNFSI
jgi:hypothetical protein